MITSSIPFPPVSWWVNACISGSITFDLAEHYQKMSYRNRYYLASPEGRLLMSLPLTDGRNQRIPVSQVKIAGTSAWQDNHWKTIVSLYRRSPFFEYFEHLLQPLFLKHYELLHDWNKAGIERISDILGLGLTFSETAIFQKSYPESITDLREKLVPREPLIKSTVTYYQVFSERTGFQPDCSILDLLFCEGMQAKDVLNRMTKDV
jgi:hypothetical protein